MRRYLFIALLVISSSLFAQEELTKGLVLETAPIDRSDVASIKRGANFFKTNCMSCHTLVYLRYDPIAQDTGITYDKMPINVKEWPYGVKPPDLSLEADIRGVNWLYTYLHGFYKDSSRPTGVNNLLVHNTAMPNIVGPYQGEQIRLEQKAVPSIMTGQIEWYDLLELTKQGSLSPEEFDKTIADLVNFLAYAAAPYQMEQRHIGYWVLSFLAVFFVFAYLLKKEYWKDVKKYKKHG